MSTLPVTRKMNVNDLKSQVLRTPISESPDRARRLGAAQFQSSPANPVSGHNQVAATEGVPPIGPAVILRKVPAIPPLYSPAQIRIATFIGGAATGGILVAINQFKLKQISKAVCFAFAGLATTAALIIAGLVFSEMPSPIGLMVAIGVAFMVEAIAKREFKESYAIQSLTKKRISNWNVASIVTAGTVVVTTVVVYIVTTQLT